MRFERISYWKYEREAKERETFLRESSGEGLGG
jgi:hypothetical protein